MRIGNTISLAWYLTNRILISLLNRFTGISNCIMHFLLLKMLLIQNENFAFKVSLSLIRLPSFRIKLFSSLGKEIVEIGPKRESFFQKPSRL